MTDLVPARTPVRLAVRGIEGMADARFPVRRIYCVGRNFADHAREMGATAPASKQMSPGSHALTSAQGSPGAPTVPEASGAHAQSSITK